MSTSKQHVSKQHVHDLINQFIHAQSEYGKYLINNSSNPLQQVINAFKDVENAIDMLPLSYQDKLVLIKAQLEQWQGITHALYASQLFETKESYSNIRQQISESLCYFESSKHKINNFEVIVNYSDWIVMDHCNGGILIDFGDFRIVCIDFYILKYQLFQNYGSVLASTLADIDIDIYKDKYKNIKLGTNYLRFALQILRDFNDMIKNNNENDDIEYISNNKINKQQYRIPRTSFCDHSVVSSMDEFSENQKGFKQYLIDIKCKTYFELGKAYELLCDYTQSGKIYDEGINEFINRSNHGHWIENEQPHSWFQLIKQAIRFYMTGYSKQYNKNKAYMVIQNVLTFYQNENYYNGKPCIDILEVKGELLVYDNDFNNAILIYEQIKSKNSISTIKRIVNLKNDLENIIHTLKKRKDNNNNFYEWIKQINIQIMTQIYYNEYWNIFYDCYDNHCPLPIDMCYDIIQFVFKCLGIEKELENINMIQLLQCINQWNGIQNKLQNNNDNYLQILVMKLKKKESKILIDFLHFGAMSYLHRMPIQLESSIKIMRKIIKLSMYSKCIEREALLWFKLAKCYKAIGKTFFPKAIECLTKASECAEKIGNIQIVRKARLIHVEIFDIQNNYAVKDATIEQYLEKKYNINNASKYINNYGDSFQIVCEYDNNNHKKRKKNGKKKRKKEVNKVKVQFMGLQHINGSDGEISSDCDDISMINNAMKPSKKVIKQRQKPNVNRNKRRFSDSDEDNTDENRQLYSNSNSNSRKRKGESELKLLGCNQNRHKRRKLTDDCKYDNYKHTKTINLQSNNKYIKDIDKVSKRQHKNVSKNSHCYDRNNNIFADKNRNNNNNKQIGSAVIIKTISQPKSRQNAICTYDNKSLHKIQTTNNLTTLNENRNNNNNKLNIKNNPIGITIERYQWIILMSGNNNNIKPFEKNEEKKIEESYCKGDKKYNCGNYEIIFNRLGNYKKLILTNKIHYNVQRIITLKSLHPTKIRNGWSNFWKRDKNNSNKRRYKLNKCRDRTEYNSICELMKNRGMNGGLEIHRIERIQNITNQNRYNDCQMGCDNQLLLFHGTRKRNVKGIINEGTDFRLHGDNGTKYGNGSYYAVYSSYAAKFSNQSHDIEIGKMVKQMFLCAVKAGKYCKGKKGMRRPPKICPNRNNNCESYDTVVDDIKNPSMFVTFDNSQSLPLYLITFTFDE